MKRLRQALDRLAATATAAGLVLVIPLSLLLFLQWPLRDLLGRYSREANDLAQILFAFYVSLALCLATRRRAHLAADAFARRYPAALQERLHRWSAIAMLLPWSLFMLVAAMPSLVDSIRHLEGFPETYNPGYWLIKLAGGVLIALVLVQALVDAFATRDQA